MKKKMLLMLLSLVFTVGFSDLLLPNTAKASETSATVIPSAYQINITQYPTKSTYTCGESLDLTGLTVVSSNYDGTSSAVTDYTTEGFQSNLVGVQTIFVHYQNCSANFTVTVNPAKVMNVSVLDHSTTAYTLGWAAATDVSYYEIYSLDELTGSYNYNANITNNSYTIGDSIGSIKSYKIRAVKNLNGIIYTGEFSEPIQAATSPEAVTALNIVITTTNSVELSWSAVNGATGYSIYRCKSSTSDFIYCGTTTSTTYLDAGLQPGVAYQYKVCAYLFDTSFLGEFSPVADTSTNPAKVVLKYKAGDEKLRLTWSKVTGATSYDLYADDGMGGYYLLTTNIDNTNCTYVMEGLTNGVPHLFYAIAHRSYQGKVYDGPQSDILTAVAAEPEATNTTAKYFADEAAFQASSAFQRIPFFKNNVSYSKSYVIPGLVTTNIGGFVSYKMCPQGIAFVENYLLITAYDLSNEENSVVYVLEKTTKALLTTLVLPTSTHVGGICYDGKYVWVTTGTKVSCFLFSDITTAISSGEACSYISFVSSCKVGFAASYTAYYNNKLWVGSYNELKATYMYSYTVDDFDTSVALTKADTVKMPTRVQGIAFTEDGYVILSRSCQLYKGLRGYMRRLDVYKPDFADEDIVKKSLGTCLNYVYTPSMNEGIAIDGTDLYVSFESGSFAYASYQVDRVCAFDIASVIGEDADIITQ